jgi:formamidopyrimidine-DNA glycosylase
MPELPEVETVRRGLAGTVLERTVVDVTATGARTVRRTSASSLAAGLTGRTIVDAGRRGKYLLLGLDSGSLLLVHLRMSGQLLLVDGSAPTAKHTHVVLTLDDGRELRFVDPRTFGEVVVVDPTQLDVEAPDLATLGPDALDLVAGPPAAVHRLLLARRRQLKALLTDQHAIAGLGNIYTDEILHAARLAPTRVSSSVSRAEARRLHAALGDVLGAAIEARGSSLGDAQYVDLWGQGGGYQAQHRVYGRAGQRCTRCRGTIERVVWSGRSTSWCPGCQR